ncbi:MAG: SH3 domain-containing protein [Betaproteobacteria bacterium]|nr:SH3 domain-containing protein [Betaproteobacteria bacterium]
MRRRARASRLLLAAALACLPLAARASDFRSVADSAAVLYDAPSTAANPLYVVSHDYPLEVIVNLESWAKVRDATGALSWIQKKDLTDQRTVLVTAASASVYARPDPTSPVAFVAVQNVVLELLESAPGGWLHVRLPGGPDGYVQIGAVWGA